MTIPFTLVGLDHVVFLVDDMPRAMAFYRDVLGCVPGYTYPALGMEQVWAGSALIVLWDIPIPARQRLYRQCKAAAMWTTSVSPPARLLLPRCGPIWQPMLC